MVLKKRLTNLGGILKRSNSQEATVPNDDVDTPEANTIRGVRQFCESGAANSGEEVLHLPTIVESAVASPQAAQAAATQIRKFLSKENYDRPHVQYNAVMLIRILADNPGQSFTKNLDKTFADTVKHLLRNGRDPSVAQILRETLNSMHREKAYDTNLNTLFNMWTKEKKLMAEAAIRVGPRPLNAPPWPNQPMGGAYNSGHAVQQGLPPPIELAARIEEARTSAKLLLQLVQSTPANELLGNDLVKEFSERCNSAQRSVQQYINCDRPAPDDDTMLTLIETNEQLSLAASKHQRAVLQARRALGASPSPPVQNNHNNFNPLPPAPAPAPVAAYTPPPPQSGPVTETPMLPPLGLGAEESPVSHQKDGSSGLQSGAARQGSNSPDTEDNPFADHHSAGYNAPAANKAAYVPFSQGYQATPSYLGRQESSSNNLTMHGATQKNTTEEEEYARDYPAGDRSKPPEDGHERHGSDVSPITDRGTVTYRY